MRLVPEEDLAIDLAGLLIAPTFPKHKPLKAQKAWFRGWERMLSRSIRKYAQILHKRRKPLARKPA